MPDPASAARAFAPFTTAHFVVLAIFALWMLAVILFARPVRATPSLRHLELALAATGIACWFIAAAWWLLPSNFRLDKSLPLALCDIASLLAPIALLWPRRLLHTLTYFWGFGLCTQAFITPTLEHGPSHPYFWIFWFQHFIIVGAAIYIVVLRDYRPAWTDYWLAITASYFYLGVAMLTNHFLTANYGYVGNIIPDSPTIIDRLGPWPRRVLWIIVLVHIAFAITMLPWLLAGRLGRKGNADPETD